MKFKFNRGTDMRSLNEQPKAVLKAIEMCGRMKIGDLVDSPQLAQQCGWVSSDNLKKHATNPALDGYHAVIKNKSWWGNKETVSALKKKFHL